MQFGATYIGQSLRKITANIWRFFHRETNKGLSSLDCGVRKHTSALPHFWLGGRAPSPPPPLPTPMIPTNNLNHARIRLCKICSHNFTSSVLRFLLAHSFTSSRPLPENPPSHLNHGMGRHSRWMRILTFPSKRNDKIHQKILFKVYDSLRLAYITYYKSTLMNTS